jgi:hypothetical protein
MITVVRYRSVIRARSFIRKLFAASGADISGARPESEAVWTYPVRAYMLIANSLHRSITSKLNAPQHILQALCAGGAMEISRW